MFGRPALPATAAALALALAALLSLAAAPPARAETPRFGLPVDCAMGTVCLIQKYVDHDPGPGRRDYACGRLSRDGDTGTDFRLPNLEWMRRGVPVLAAAAGQVTRVRDGMPDVNVDTVGQASLDGKWAGNAVVIDHGDGWETQYSHLRKGSILVRPGDRVRAGEALGLIGLSGNTEFPHVEFSVRRGRDAVDPFVGPDGTTACDDPRAPMWTDAALESLPYIETAPLQGGFTGDPSPSAEEARAGGYEAETLTQPPVLVFWTEVMGAMAGDLQEVTIRDPKGRVVHQWREKIPKSNILWFAFSGRRTPPEGWAPGPYTGVYRLLRDGETVFALERTTTIGGE